MKKKVSVIIPVFNVEKYVKQSILSIINQSLHEIEIIIINDGSTDSSLKIIQELAEKDSRIEIISIPNNGLSIARNLGIYRATGEFIYFFDSDDLLESNTLELCYNKCIKNNLDFVFFDADVFTEDNININTFNYIRTNLYKDTVYSGIDILNKQLASGGYRSSSCLNFIKRDFLDSIQLYFYPKILHEDELFTFILYLHAKKVGLYPKIFFHRRIRKGSIMTSVYGNKRTIGYLTVCRELYYHSQLYSNTQASIKLLKQRIYYLLQVVLYTIDIKDKNEYNEIRNTILYEFKNCIPRKFYLKLKYPQLYNTFLYRFYN